MKRGVNIMKKEYIIQIVIGALALLLVVFMVVKVVNWNKGKDSDYNPDENNTEFDVEPTDYIQPLSAEQIAGKVDDGATTFLCIGNSPFADNYSDNNLAEALGEVYDATVINAGIAGSYITQKNAEVSADYIEDGVSLYQMATAIGSGDFSTVKATAESMGDEARAAVSALENTDFTKVDAIFIMYNLEDYADHRPLGSESVEDVTCIYGAVFKAIQAIQEAYPYIKVIMLSQPAGGITIDNFYVDGDKHDIGCGTLTDYVTFETQAVASRGACFVDVYYGAINIDQRDEYLYDDYHINDDGAMSIARRVKKLGAY